MKNKYFSLRNILIISMFIIFSQTCVYSQLIRNYSFEFRHDTCLPYGISPSYMGGSIPGYDRSELMRCIGYCENHNIWSPVSSSNICDENSSYPFPLNGGWYLPTNCGSTDYFHVLGTLGAGSEEIYVFKYGQGIKYPEKRYPAGWSSDSYNADSAFIGFAMRAKKPGSGLSNVSAKEYIQSKLTEPLIGPAFYEVSFMVSRSNYSPAIHSLGALFTYNSVVNPIGYYDFL